MKRTYLQELREKQGLNATGAAYHMGISEASYRLIESGRSADMRMSTLERLAESLNTPIEQLARLESEYRRALEPKRTA